MPARFTPYRINHLEENQIFVFGSNEAGRHGAGAAATAKHKFGAKNRVGNGIQGQSYGIPTKDKELKRLGLGKIRKYAKEFLEYAREHPENEFLLTAIGCGLAHNKPKDIAPMFKNHPENVILPLEFYKVLYPNTPLI